MRGVPACRQLDEQTKLSDAVQRHMKLQAGQASMQTLLQPYVDAGIDNLGLLLRDELRPVRLAFNWPSCVPPTASLPLSCTLHYYD